MEPLQLILGTYNDAPLGVSAEVLEQTYQESYKPFLSLLNSFPELPAALHFSGPLLEWLEDAHPELFMLLQEMVGRKQVELVGGAFYDAALSIIPNADRLGQIERLTTYLRSHFGVRPRGSALAAGVWEPSLASTLNNSGMEYVLLEGAQLERGGVAAQDLHRPYLTEDQGKTVAILPVTFNVLPQMAQATPEQVVAQLAELASDGPPRSVVVFDRGAPLPSGLSLGRRNAWLTEFFRLVLEASWIKPIVPRACLRSHSEPQRVYLPCTVSNGNAAHAVEFFRQNLTRYPDSNRIYWRMMYTHLLVNQVRRDKPRKQAAMVELWRGQSHQPYWMGCHGGIANARARHAVYAALIEAEKTARDYTSFQPSLLGADIDMDGHSECLYQGKVFNAYVHRHGGAIVELDHLATTHNYLATLTRTAALHGSDDLPATSARRDPLLATADTGNGARPHDRYPRQAFVDHFLDDEFDLSALQQMRFRDLGDLADSSYVVDELDRDRLTVSLHRNALINTARGRQPAELRKRYRFRGRSLTVSYAITNSGDAALDVRFGVEVNLAFLDAAALEYALVLRDAAAGGAASAAPRAGDTAAALDGDGELRFMDRAAGVVVGINLSECATVCCTPVTAADSYQYTSTMALWPLALAPGEHWETSVGLSFSRLRG